MAKTKKARPQIIHWESEWLRAGEPGWPGRRRRPTRQVQFARPRRDGTPSLRHVGRLDGAVTGPERR